jgi:hypothetical protein
MLFLRGAKLSVRPEVFSVDEVFIIDFDANVCDVLCNTCDIIGVRANGLDSEIASARLYFSYIDDARYVKYALSEFLSLGS